MIDSAEVDEQRKRRRRRRALPLAPGGVQSFVYERSLGDRPGNIFVRRADGTTERLTRGRSAEFEGTRSPDASRIDLAPRWSPGGNRIAFIRETRRSDEIFTMKPKGRRVRRLTKTRENEADLDWAPDASRIVFTNAVGLGERDRFEMFTMGPSGEDVEILPTPEVEPIFVSWSPSGTRIAFDASVYPGSLEPAIFTVEVDGEGLRQVSSSEVYSSVPAWQPLP